MTDTSTTSGGAGMLARFKDLCIDAVDVERAARFWSAALGLEIRRSDADVWLVGKSAAHAIWINQVPEPKTVKNRVHLDVHTGSLADLTDGGARVLQPATADHVWTVLTDPDGQEFCAFAGEQVPEYRLYEVVLDCADPGPLASWWASVLGGELKGGGDEWWLTKAPGVPFEYLAFGRVPEPKTVKNRVHWDLYGDPGELVTRGATLLRARGGDLDCHVLADPEGNEFCVWEPTAEQGVPG